MSKYYVQSNDIRWVLLAADYEGAALRFAQLTFQHVLKGQQKVTADFSLVDEDKFSVQRSQFGEKILISESGFNGQKVGIYESSAVIDRWRKQIHSLESMIRKMG